jgi:enamine deaminase RidA (YjgF/YER057c/UK114 family)
MAQVEYLNPPGLPTLGYSNVVTVTGNVKTVYIGGQDAVDASGNVVGKGDLAAQTAQIFKNVQTCLDAAGAKLEQVIKWNIYIVQGNNPQAGFEVFQRVWGNRGNFPIVTVVFVAGLGRPDFLCEIEAIAVVPI